MQSVIRYKYIILNYTLEYRLLVAAERASLKRASEAANLIYVYGENLSQTTVYRRALWSCAIGNAR